MMSLQSKIIAIKASKDKNIAIDGENTAISGIVTLHNDIYHLPNSSRCPLSQM